MDRNTSAENSKVKLAQAIKHLRERSTLSPISSSEIRDEIAKKYNVTVVISFYLIRLGYMKRIRKAYYIWNENAPNDSDSTIAQLVMDANRKYVSDYMKRKKKATKNESKNKSENKSEKIQPAAVPDTNEAILNCFEALTPEQRIFICTSFLKKSGYRILKPVTEYKEL